MSLAPPSARREAIGGRLERGRSVTAVDLAEEFNVSEDAIRRDLRALAAEGRCRRVYGGALPLSPASNPIAERVEEHWQRKVGLAKAAASLVRPSQVIFLDASSTNLALARELADDQGLTVVTNSIPIAAAIYERSGIELVLMGGAVSRAVGGIVDSAAVVAVGHYSFDWCFLGVCALSLSRGAGVFDLSDAAFKRALLNVSEHVATLVLDEKLETRAPHRVAGIDAFRTLVLETTAPTSVIDGLVELGVTIVAGEPAL